MFITIDICVSARVLALCNYPSKHIIVEKKMISFGLGVFPKIILSENIFENKLPVSYANFILENYYDPFHKILSNQINKLLNKLFH